MDTQKIVIIVLILIVVVFVIFVTRGSLTDDQPKRTNSTESKKDAANIPLPDWSKTINKIFGGLEESVDVCDEPSANTEIKCELPLGNIEIKPAKEPWLPILKKSSFRTVKLVWISGTVSVLYVDKKGGSDIDNPQTFDLPDPKNNSSKFGSLVIMENGGTLTISCKENTKCQIGQE